MPNRKLLITGGSVPGREHLYAGGGLLGVNNHDAIVWEWWTPSSGVLLVGDGVGGDLPKETDQRPPFSLPRRRRSEIGSNLGEMLLKKHFSLQQAAVRQQLLECLSGNARLPVELPVLKRIREDFLAELRVIASLMRSPNESFTDIIQRFFLFPIQVAVAFPEVGAVIGTGDGINVVNGELKILEPDGPNNTPACLAYNVIDAVEFRDHPDLLKLRVRRIIPGDEMDFIALGTDGAAEIEAVADRRLPGSADFALGLEQFWTADMYWLNRQRIQGRLNLFQGLHSVLNNGDPSRPAIRREEPLLYDDTTVGLMKFVSE